MIKGHTPLLSSPGGEDTNKKQGAKTSFVPVLRLVPKGVLAFFLVSFVAVIVMLVVAIMRPERASLKLNGQHFSLEVAKTQSTREQGLSGRANMPKNGGMVFVFDQPDTYCFWMKDMHFNLDIIWLDEAKRVVMVQQNVSPSSYPHNFCPNQPARYVIELHSNAEKTTVRVGDKLDLSL